MSKNQPERAARSLQQQIERHEGFLENPSSHEPNWSSLRLERKLGLIEHWSKEISNFVEQQQILEHLLAR